MDLSNNNSLIIYLSFVLIYSFYFIYKFDFFLKKIKIYDKKNKDKLISCSGGIFIYVYVFISFCYFFLNIEHFSFVRNFFHNFSDQINFSLKEMLVFILMPSIFFAVGLFDDKYSLSANIRIFIFFIISIILISFDKDNFLTELNFSFVEKTFELNDIFSVIFTSLCIISFLVALNMYDGINLQTAGYLIFLCIVFLLNNILEVFIIGLLIVLITFSYLNFKNKCFLGDSGTYFCATMFALILIKSSNKNIFYADQIIFLLIIPMLDMIRVIILRLIRGKHPFKGDKTHLHHIIGRKINKLIVFIIILSLNIVAYLSYLFLYQKIFSLLITLSLYLITLFYFRKKNEI